MLKSSEQYENNPGGKNHPEQDHNHEEEHSHEGHDHHHGGAGHVHGATHGPLLWISLTITLVFVIGEYIAGRKANSLALVSDAGHNLSDALALGLAAYAVHVAKKPANAQKTYGYHRVGILTALFNAATLIGIAVFIFVEAWHLFHAPEASNGTLMLWVAGVAVLMNTVIAYLLQSGAKDSMNMRAAFVHMAGDALSSLGVLIAGFIVHKTGWRYADPTVSVLIALFIIYSSWGIVRDATDVLLESTPKNLDTEKMVAAMRQVGSVLAVHDLHTWTVSDGMNYLSCHVVVEDDCTLTECGAIMREINELLAHDYEIAHATIQIENSQMCDTEEGERPLFCDEFTAAPHKEAASGK